MIGLIALAVFGIYILLSIFVIVFVAKAAINSGKSSWRWGVGTALFMYLIVFYDHIPTILLHKYYCATKAGFWVYKTPEQWKAENPETVAKMTWKSIPTVYKTPGATRGGQLNDRFARIHKISKFPIFPVKIDRESIIDIKTKETMVERVKISSGYGTFPVGGKDWRVIKFWIGSDPCLPKQSEFEYYANNFQRIGKKVE